MDTTRAFKPLLGSTVSLAVTTTSARVALTSAPKNATYQLRLYNAGASTVHLTVGTSSATATTSNLPLPAGAIEVLTFENRDNAAQDNLAAITASGTATLYATIGA